VILCRVYSSQRLMVGDTDTGLFHESLVRAALDLERDVGAAGYEPVRRAPSVIVVAPVESLTYTI
jgi:hypothetical protein